MSQHFLNLEGRIFLILMCFVLLISPSFSVCSAETENQDALSFMNIRIPVPEGMTASMEGSEYYIYAGQKGSIPYIMLRTYRSDDGEAFLTEFTSYMHQKYADLTVTAEIHRKQIGDRECYETDYRYQISGYDVTDRRIVMIKDGTAYLFTSKEVESLGLTVGGMLEKVIADSIFLSEEELRQESGLAEGYLYCQENGMPLFWLDFTGIASDQIVLHCCASTGDPATCERRLLLDLTSASVAQEGITIHQVRDMEGKDLSGCFKSLMLQIFRDGVLMTSEPDADSGNDTGIILPSGSFAMSPVHVAADRETGMNHLCPALDGPYQPEELQAWARIYDFRATGTYHEGSEVTENPDGTFNIYLYDGAEKDTAVPEESFLRYVVDAHGTGVDVLTGDPVSVMK